MIDSKPKFSRRQVVKGIAAVAGAPLAIPYFAPSLAANNEPIRLSVVVAQLPDFTDYLNGAQLAADEINAAGGVRGREIQVVRNDIDLWTVEGTQAGMRAIADSQPHAIGCNFLYSRIPGIEALGDWKAPYLTGDTSIALIEYGKKNRDKYWNFFHLDPPEIYYGRMFPKFLEATAADGVWKPINNKVHLIRESSQYNMTIADEVIKTLPQSKFTLATITDIQNPVQDWGPVMQAIKQEGCGTIMLDYWSASEEAAFCQQFINDPVKGALVYIHYGPSQTEFLQIASGAAEGMVWSTMFGIYPNAQGKEFRAKFQRRHPGPVPLSCPALAYDTVNVLKNAWQSADPSDFKAVADYIRTHPYRGVVGTINMNNEDQAGLHYPMQTKDMNQGMAQLYYQVQDGEHKVIQPTALAESKFKSVPWA